jgi:hypothetical protein
MNSNLSAALFSGFIAGLSGLAVFLVVHALWILPIWFILPMGIPIAGIGGVAVGWAYAEIAHRLPVRPWRTPAVAALVSLILLPYILIAELRPPMFIVSGSGIAVLMMSVPEAVLRFIGDLLIPAGVSGGVLGAWLGRTRRATIMTFIAALTLALGPGHNIPFLGTTTGVGKEITIIALVNIVSALTLVEVHAQLSLKPRLSGSALNALISEERHTL